jgi:hypothetical protein
VSHPSVTRALAPFVPHNCSVAHVEHKKRNIESNLEVVTEVQPSWGLSNTHTPGTTAVSDTESSDMVGAQWHKLRRASLFGGFRCSKRD